MSNKTGGIKKPNLYVSNEGLEGLKHYKYVGVDHSIIAPLLQPFWRKSVELLPKSLAPNTVTTLGLCFVISSFLLTAFYSPDLFAPAPHWVYFYHGFAVFMYQTLDALDGKQARRINMASPLGELFDHGCDAITTTLISLSLFSSLRVGPGWFSFSILMMNLVLFYVAQWEEYHTGTLELGYINVTEAQLCTILLHFTTAYYGPDFWTQTLQIGGFSITYYYLPSIPTIFVALFTIGKFFWNVTNEFFHKQKMNPILVYAHLIPIVFVVLFGFLWAYYSPDNILYTHTCFYMIAIGMIFATLVGKLVVARICRMKFNWIQPMIVPLIFGFLNAYLDEAFIDEMLFVKLTFVITILAYLHFAYYVIDALTHFLNIQCFFVGKKLKSN